MAKEDEETRILDKKQLDRIVARLRTVVVGGHITVMAEAGEVILEEVFKGNVDAARSLSKYKEQSIEALAARANEFGMTPSGVRKAIPVALQVRLLGKSLGLQLGVAQHLALLPLRNPKEKKVLAESAVKERWQAREMRDKVHELQPRHEGGRKGSPAAMLLSNRLHRVFAPKLISKVDEDLDGVPLKDLQKLLGQVNGGMTHLQRLQRVLAKAVAHAAGEKAAD